MVRSPLPPEALVPAVRSALREVDPNLPTGEFQTLESIVDRAVSPRRFVLQLLGAFAAAALLLAVLGIYGVLSYSVSQRAREIGIRMAMGATATRVQRCLVLRTLALCGLGILLGTIGSFLLTKTIASLLYGVRATDPASFLMMVLSLVSLSALAAYLPARRASRIEPMSVLRLA